MALSRFFIDRPVFAWVIAIVIMLAGGIAAFNLPIAAISHHRPARGGDQRHLSRRRRQHAAELRHPGDRAAAHRLDNLLYFSSHSNADGTVPITATFAAGTNPDIAQVQVQNKVQPAVPLLPAPGAAAGRDGGQGRSPTSLVIVAIYDDTGRYNNVDISDFITSKMQDPLSRVTGVGNTQVFGAQYAMRIWLDPYKLHNYALQPSDVYAAIQAQNVQVSAGQIGAQPAAPGQAINATVTAQSQLQTPEQFRNIILKTRPAARWCRLARCRAR